jgi:hypothetical protein
MISKMGTGWSVSFERGMLQMLIKRHSKQTIKA